MTAHRDTPFERAQRLFDGPMVFLAFVLLGILVARAMLDLPPQIEFILEGADWLIWCAFALELFVMTVLSPHRFAYLISHWYNVLVVAIPALRIFRLFTLFRLPTTIRFARGFNALVEAIVGTDVFLARIVPLSAKTVITAKHFIKEHRFDYVIGALVMIVFVLGSVVSIFEAPFEGSTIKTAQDGIWWSIETVTTVGYGDFFPVTLEGKIIGVVLMAFGITTFSLLTANIAKYLINDKSASEKQMDARVHALEKKIDKLTELLEKKTHQTKL